MSKSVIDIVAPISEHVPSDYEMKMSELEELFGMAHAGKLWEAISIAYDMGMLRGVNAASRGKLTSNDLRRFARELKKKDEQTA